MGLSGRLIVLRRHQFCLSNWGGGEGLLASSSTLSHHQQKRNGIGRKCRRVMFQPCQHYLAKFSSKLKEVLDCSLNQFETCRQHQSWCQVLQPFPKIFPFAVLDFSAGALAACFVNFYFLYNSLLFAHQFLYWSSNISPPIKV